MTNKRTHKHTSSSSVLGHSGHRYLTPFALDVPANAVYTGKCISTNIYLYHNESKLILVVHAAIIIIIIGLITNMSEIDDNEMGYTDCHEKFKDHQFQNEKRRRRLAWRYSTKRDGTKQQKCARTKSFNCHKKQNNHRRMLLAAAYTYTVYMDTHAHIKTVFWMRHLQSLILIACTTLYTTTWNVFFWFLLSKQKKKRVQEFCAIAQTIYGLWSIHEVITVKVANMLKRRT